MLAAFSLMLPFRWSIDRDRSRRRRIVGPFTTSLVCVMAMVGTSVAESPAASDNASAARALMERVNAAYTSLFNTPRKMLLKQTTTTRAIGTEDVRTRSKAVVYQYRDKVRYEIGNEDHHVERTSIDDDDPEIAEGGRLVWVHADGQTRTRYEEAADDHDSGPIVHGTFVDHTRLPDELGPEFTRPMTMPEFSRHFLDHPFHLRTEPYQGTNYWVLRSDSWIEFGPGQNMAVTMWVDVATFRVERFVATTFYRPEKDAEPYVTEYAADIEYFIGADIPEGAFELPEDASATDITEMVARHARSLRRIEDEDPQ